MSKLIVHAKIMIDGLSDTPKKDQLISIEDGKIVSIEEYHETNEEVIHANRTVDRDGAGIDSLRGERLI